jgi:hypothetical protein
VQRIFGARAYFGRTNRRILGRGPWTGWHASYQRAVADLLAREIFAQRGFRMFDPVRGRLREDRRVKWWYRQNLVLFASEEGIARNPALQREPEVPAGAELEWVHFDIIRVHRDPRFLARHGLGRAWKRLISKTGRPKSR